METENLLDTVCVIFSPTMSCPLPDHILHLTFYANLLHMPILGSSNSAADKSIMSKIWTNGVQLSD